MSRSLDCIIVGGGIVGLTIARKLSRDGRRVMLIDRAECGREASWAGAGILSPCNPHREDPLSHLQDRSLDLYADLCPALHDETGIDPEYDPCGELSLLFTENTLSIARSDERVAAGTLMPDGCPVYNIHDADSLRAVAPFVGAEAVGALECRQTAQVRNPRLLQALRASCLGAGTVIKEHTPVEQLVMDGSRVTGVRVADEALASDMVILAAGAWSSQLSPQLESLVPVSPVRGQMILLRQPERPFRPVISSGKSYLVARRDGRILLGSTEEPDAGFQKRNTPQGVSALMETALKMVPSLAGASVEAMWSGLRPATPDGRPYIGPVPGFDGLIAATGHFRTGLTLAPVTAEVVAALLEDRAFDLDLSCCLPGRA